MNRIDVINSTDYGYRVLWTERHYLMRLAGVPVLIKLVCFGIVMLLGWEKDSIRVALVMLPSFLTEGWMLAHVSRFVFFGQRWPFRPTGNVEEDEAQLRDRALGVSAGAVAYTLMKYILSGLLGVVETAQSQFPPPGSMHAAQPPDPGMAFAALLFVIFSLWMFRYLFYYIPLSVGYGWRALKGAGRGFITSVQFMGVWLVTFVPWVLLLMIFSAGIISLFHQDGAGDLPAPGECMLLIIQVLADTGIALVTTAAISHAILKMNHPDGV